jgi:hypothetical protein
MPTLRRILKYTPVVVMGLLVVAWVVSWFGVTASQTAIRQHNAYFASWQGTLYLGFDPNSYVDSVMFSPEPFRWTGIAGRLDNMGRYGTIPYVVLITFILPLAIGPFIRFRFRLWHYLAYTAIVAVELAYYLRWQE